MKRVAIARTSLVHNKTPLAPYLQSLLDKYGGLEWALNDVAGKPYCDVINGAVAKGRNLALTPDFATDTNWVKDTGVTISGGVGVFTAVTVGLGLKQTLIQLGRAYEITYDVVVTSGTIRASAGSGTGNGTIRSVSGTYTETMIGTTSTTFSILAVTTFTGTVDNVSVKELNIPAYNAVPVQLLNTDVWNGAGVGAWTPSANATLSAPSTTRHDGSTGTVLRIARNGGLPNARQLSIFTVGQVYRIYGWWRGDGTAVPRIINNAGSLILAGTASTDWQPFDFVLVATETMFIFQASTTTGTTYAEFDVTVVALDTGIRQGNVGVGIDFDMEMSGVTHWTAVNSATLTKVIASPNSGVQNLRITAGVNASPQAQFAFTPLVIGKTYIIQGFFRTITTGTGGGNITQSSGVGFGSSSNLGHSSTSAWSSFSTVGVATGTTFRLSGSGLVNGEWIEFDDITITELSPLVAIPSATVTLGVTENNRLLKSASFNGSNSLINLYSAQLNSVFNPNEGTLLAFGKLSDWGTTNRRLITIGDAANNRITLNHSGVTNEFSFNFTAGGTSIVITDSSLAGTSNWFFVALTYSKSADQVNVYINQTLVGTLTGLGVWAANFLSTTCCIGASQSSGTAPWSGNITRAMLLPIALSASEILESAILGDCA